MNDKKKLRRLRYFLNENTQFLWMYEYRQRLGFGDQLEEHIRNFKDEILKLKEELNLTEENFVEIWKEVTSRKVNSRSESRRRPIQSRRDNKDVRVGSGGSNRNKVRFPKKCRKTAWKRFYKLFPHLNPEGKKP